MKRNFLVTFFSLLSYLTVFAQSTECFYGVSTTGGGIVGTPDIAGCIYQWEPVTKTFTIKQRFSIPEGVNPFGPPTFFNGKFYGNLYAGGTNFQGALYEWDPLANILTKKIDFHGSNGYSPVGKLVLLNDKFYSMTVRGGSNPTYGVIYEWDPVSNVLTPKHSFDQVSGGRPYSSLALFEDKFYGTGMVGGVNDRGVIFQWDPATNLYSKKIDLSLTTGSKPIGGLTYYNGKFYGMTS